MKHFCLSLCLTALSFTTLAQKTVIKWGNEFKLRKGSTDLKVIHAGDTGALMKKSKTIDGLLVQRINVTNGKVVLTSDKSINNSLLSANPDNADDDEADDKEETKEEKS
ncbi:hypothetical protein [Chitinophaga eiseniae]|uniref:Uncharacterized protein n=1 Tax=Chitinophaga eiseniae TaxID=634771 RepID=A0A847SQF0_9BACT|nr:hypothetical protein [Chitinophaga eiseniae]NLR79519.1 hypothetical protein [Chitinophaga eiseniae]